MARLTAFIDYDNVAPALTRAGPIALVRALMTLIPADTLSGFDSVRARMYGGWREQGNLTTSAQRLVPDIRANSPSMLNVAGISKQLRLNVELADRQLGAGALLTETFVRDRSPRKFRTRPTPWSSCATPNACGLSGLNGCSYRTACAVSECQVTAAEIFVRDEQKMVDTMMVADIAFEALQMRAPEIVVVSSDVDMWPGVLLALSSGCSVTQIHSQSGWRTQRHLVATLTQSMSRNYRQISP